MPFLRAGFNPHHRRLCVARVRCGRHHRWAELLLMRPSGDLWWYVKLASGALLEWNVDFIFERLDSSVIPLQRPQSSLSA